MLQMLRMTCRLGRGEGVTEQWSRQLLRASIHDQRLKHGQFNEYKGLPRPVKSDDPIEVLHQPHEESETRRLRGDTLVERPVQVAFV